MTMLNVITLKQTCTLKRPILHAARGVGAAAFKSFTPPLPRRKVNKIMVLWELSLSFSTWT